jgi:signal peptidase
VVRRFVGGAWVRRLWAALWFLPSLLIDWIRYGDGGQAKEQAAEATPQPGGQEPPQAMAAAEAVAVPEVTVPLPAKKRRIIRGVISWVLYFGFIVAAIVAGPKLLAIALETDTPLAAVTSSSMWPTLKRGDLVVIKGVNSVDDIQVGDIVAYESDEAGFVIHRVVSIEGENITTKGDANAAEDEPISSDQLIGKVLELGGRMVKVPYLGSLPAFFRSTSDGGAGQPEAAFSEAGY